MDFINAAEVEHFASIAGTKYRKSSDLNVADGERLKALVKKLNTWIKDSATSPFIVYSDTTWQWSGTFKSYLWIRVYKNARINIPLPRVYFVFGVNDNADLYMELNCQRSNHTMGANIPLESEKIRTFDEYLKFSEYRPRYISSAELQFYNWDRLILETSEFIASNTEIYHELLNIVDPESTIGASQGSLQHVSKPVKINSRMPDIQTFRGVEVDFEKIAKTSKYLGDSGEDIVLQYEKEKLVKWNHFDLVENVRKVKDGEGYDILSYDKNRNQIHIEVKTTTGTEKEPFYLSHNELSFAESNPNSYFIYRVFNFRPVPKSGGSFFIWTWDDLSKATRKSLHYEISMNNQ
jgi:hypothetical protein